MTFLAVQMLLVQHKITNFALNSKGYNDERDFTDALP